MSVIKIYPERDFTTLHNKNIWDTNLSNETIGFWIRCVSMKADWDFYVEDIAKRMQCSRKSVYKHIKILQSNRYCMRCDCYEKKGKLFSKKIVKYIFFMKPFEEAERQGLEEELKKCYGNAHFGDLHVGSLHTGTLTKKKDNILTESIKKNKEESRVNKQEGPPAKTLPSSKDLKKKLPKYELSQEEKKLLDDMLEFECLIGNTLDRSFLTVMFKQHGYERVKKAWEFCISKEIKSSLGGLLRTAIENQWELPNDEFKENKLLCEELASRYPSQFNVTQTYMTCHQTGVDVDFRRPNSLVTEQLAKISRQLNLRQLDPQEEVPHVTGSWE